MNWPRNAAPGTSPRYQTSFAARWRGAALGLVVMMLCATSANANQSPDRRAYEQVAGTLDIHWELISGPAGAPIGCRGVELTDGTAADAADGNVTMAGVAAVNDLCVGIDNYTFDLSPDGLSLTGFASSVPMTLTRPNVDQPWFQGDWVSQGYVFRATIAADLFPVPTLPFSIDGEYVGWFEDTANARQGIVTMTIGNSLFSGSFWSFEAIVDWRCTFGEECGGEQLFAGTMTSLGDWAFASLGFSADTFNLIEHEPTGTRADFDRTFVGSFPGGTFEVTRVSAFSVPTEVPTVQRALDLLGGDRKGLRIEVEPGAYAESLDLTPLTTNPTTVAVVGLDTAANVVFDDGVSTPGGPVVRTGGAAAQFPVVLRNLTLSGAYVQSTTEAESGAGLRIEAGTSNLVVADCILRDNRLERADTGSVSAPSGRGSGAAALSGTRVRFQDTLFLDNVAIPRVDESAIRRSEGGGLAAIGADLLVVDSEIRGNVATAGAGLRTFGGTVTLRRTSFVANGDSSTAEGGGALIGGQIPVLIEECSFLDNRATADDDYVGIFGTGGGLYVGGFTELRMTDTVFEGNRAVFNAGAWLSEMNAVVERCRFGGPDGRGNISTHPDAPNRKSRGGGLTFSNANVNPQRLIVRDTHFEGNTADLGGGLQLGLGLAYAVIDGVTFVDNTAEIGAAHYVTTNLSNSSSVRVHRSEYRGNRASDFGGALYSFGTTRITSSLMYDNEAGQGGAIQTEAGLLDVLNTSIAGNRSVGENRIGGGIASVGGELNVRNSILWGNTGTTGSVEEQQAAFTSAVTSTFASTIVEGFDAQATTLGPGPLWNTDPEFVNGPGGNLYLGPSSPAIDRGDAALIPNVDPAIEFIDITIDLNANPRVIGSEVDLGPYEFDGVTSVGPDSPSFARGPRVTSAYPNPFNPRTTIEYALNEATDATVEIYDLRGRRVKTLREGMSTAGTFTVVWDGSDESGTRVGSGAYLVVLRAGDTRDARRVTLVK